MGTAREKRLSRRTRLVYSKKRLSSPQKTFTAHSAAASKWQRCFFCAKCIDKIWFVVYYVYKMYRVFTNVVYIL